MVVEEQPKPTTQGMQPEADASRGQEEKDDGEKNAWSCVSRLLVRARTLLLLLDLIADFSCQRRPNAARVVLTASSCASARNPTNRTSSIRLRCIIQNKERSSQDWQVLRSDLGLALGTGVIGNATFDSGLFFYGREIPRAREFWEFHRLDFVLYSLFFRHDTLLHFQSTKKRF